ncbi:MAG: S9 family peptidase [Opitutaceae bacterium]|nr:S9 family peptidase [Opitutaceae bacterium]
MHPTRYVSFLAAALVCAVVAVSVRAADAVFTPQRIAELRNVTAAAISPDGQHTAYTLSVPRKPGVDDDGEAWTELWVVGAEAGAKPRAFVTGKVNVSAVRWTPDGRQIAFLAKRGDDKFRSLYLIPLAGGEAQRGFAHVADIADYSLAPDGQRVALVARPAEDEALKKIREKGFRQEVYEEDWTAARVWTAKLFSTAKAVALPLEGHARAVRWSPVDERLLVVATPTPSVDDSLMRQRLRVIDAKDGAVRAKIENPGKLGAYEWSPDGKRIAFVSGEDIHDPHAGRLMVADAASGAFGQVLAPKWEGDASDIAWLDADTIAFVAEDGVENSLARVRADARAAQPEVLLPKGTGAITAISFSRGARTFALVASTPSHPAELFTWTAGAGAAQRRTDSNPGLSGLRLARQEIVRHKARDGLGLTGILVRPLDEKPGQRYPLILAVHGGPESHVAHGWVTGYSTPGQLGAARGFAVFYPNYRGSTGRGVAFSKLGQGDAAGKEFDDLIDAVDHLIGTGLVDAKKVGVTGGSYGGYATAWCSTKFSERFAAGVMFVGISDKVSKVGTTDIADEEYYVHARKRPWEDWQFLLERSPIYHTANARTPLLILHGKDDPRVNVGQSRELHRHLKIRGQAPVRLVLYPGEEHGNRKAGARLDYNLRLMQWMEHYLTGPGGTPPPHVIDYGLATPAKN